MLSKEDFAAIDELRRKYRERMAVPCTKCGYCMPCPNGVAIPDNFEIFNDAFLHQDFPGARFLYQIFIDEQAMARSAISSLDKLMRSAVIPSK